MAATQKHFGDELASILKRALNDLEDLQVQTALGKAEARDKFEEIKKKLRTRVSSAKKTIVNTAVKSEQKLLEYYDELIVQLALGEAEEREEFERQRKKINRAFKTLEARIDGLIDHEAEEKMRHEIEKFRIQMDILKVRYELGKMDAKDEFEKWKHEATASIAKAKAKILEKKKVVAKSRAARREELKESYKHLRKAFA